jgi:hypothetical protein
MPSPPSIASPVVAFRVAPLSSSCSTGLRNAAWTLDQSFTTRGQTSTPALWDPLFHESDDKRRPPD